MLITGSLEIIPTVSFLSAFSVFFSRPLAPVALLILSSYSSLFSSSEATGDIFAPSIAGGRYSATLNSENFHKAPRSSRYFLPFAQHEIQ